MISKQPPACPNMFSMREINLRRGHVFLGIVLFFFPYRTQGDPPPHQAIVPNHLLHCNVPPLEEAMGGFQELLPFQLTFGSTFRNPMSRLKETVGNLMLLISRFHKDDPNSFRVLLERVDGHGSGRRLGRGASLREKNITNLGWHLNSPVNRTVLQANKRTNASLTRHHGFARGSVCQQQWF